MINDILIEVVPMIISILTALTSLILTIIRTREKAIKNKVDKVEYKNLLDKYDIYYNNEKIDIKNLKLKERK